ncbi:hypothetical protein MBLNU230_g6390t1 [Neophaeotheca triangularis]
MKRWQDFGEVPDSDEEDLDLATQSRDSDRKHISKKVRTDEEATQHPLEGLPASRYVPEPDTDVDDLALFTVSRPPKTYGKQARTVRPAELETLHATSGSSNSQHRGEKGRAPRVNSASLSFKEDVPRPRGVNIPITGTPALAEATATDSDPLSALPSSEVLTRNTNTDSTDKRGEAPTTRVLAAVDDTEAATVEETHSRASTPLSEREVSPPPGFLFPGLAGSNISYDGSPPIAAARPQNAQGLPETASQGSPTLQDLLASTREESRARRTFRARNEQQLHPYMYEKLAYERQWKGRGLRPIKVAEASRAAEEAQDASVSEEECQSVSHSQSSPMRHASPGGQDGDASKHVNMASNSDDELPDVDAILRRKPPRALQGVYKRRRLNGPAEPTPRRMVAVVPGPRQQPTDIDEYAIPPSPPPTSSTSPAPGQVTRPRPAFRLPLGMSPVSLPTPHVSSEGRGPVSSQTSDEENPTLVSRRRLLTQRTREISSDSGSQSDSSEVSPENEDNQLRKEKRRIRGVLPASWLKIDAKGQKSHVIESPSKARRATGSPVRTMPQKGIAQKVHGGRTNSRTPSRVQVISDDSGDDSESRVVVPPPAFEHHRLDFADNRLTVDRTTVDDDEDMEVDWIDPMLPSASRRESAGKPAEKRQPRIKDALQRVRQQPTSASEQRFGKQQRGHSAASKNTSKRHKELKIASPSAPQLSILDAPRPPSQDGGSTPTFVRLARREARNRPDKGRHSPSNKILRLVTDEDTRDATHTLKAWREHTIRPSAPHLPVNSAANVQQTRRNVISHEDEVIQGRDSLQQHFDDQQQLLPQPQQKPYPVKRIKAARPQAKTPPFRQSRIEPQLLGQGTTDGSRSEEQFVPATGTPRQQKRKPAKPSGQRTRGAQLETLEQIFDREHRQAAFERRMYSFTQGIARRNRAQAPPDFQLNRYMKDQVDDRGNGDNDRADVGSVQGPNEDLQHSKTVKLPRRPRKRAAQRLGVDTWEYRQPSEPLPHLNLADERPSALVPEVSSGIPLLGLGPFGTRYPTDFDIRPLPLGTYFHPSTLIGSGGLADALSLSDQDLDIPRGRIAIELESKSLRWSTWDEEVSSDFGLISQAIAVATDILSEPEEDASVRAQRQDGGFQTVDYLLGSLVRYLAKCLSFSDPIDRASCASRLQQFVKDIEELLGARDSLPAGFKRLCLIYSCVLSRQALSICNHAAVPHPETQPAKALVHHVSTRLALTVFPTGFAEIRQLYETIKRQRVREAGIKETSSAIHAVVVLLYVLRSDGQIGSFWDLLNKSSVAAAATKQSASALDNAWYDLFSVLPVLELNAHGTLQVGSRFAGSLDNWVAIKRFLNRLFELYPATIARPGTTINEYTRAIFIRCHCLITRWGWFRCEPILGLIFDFFAKRSMAPLQNEESRGSPTFLSELDKAPSLDVELEDRSFAIFLKSLAAGLQGMSKHSVYNAKKIGGIAWRFIPNHGRTHRKDAELQQADLDSLRNHHDLLCTLYYASPGSNRIRLDLLRNLVDHSSSHREACRLSVRAWSNLAAFQVSTDEPAVSVEPFEAWYHDMLTATLGQYRQARPEAEQQFAIAKAKGADGMTEELLSMTIASNQRQIVATLIDLLTAMRRAVATAKSLPIVTSLVQASKFWNVFELFEPGNQRIGNMLKEALMLLRTCLEKESTFKTQSNSQSSSEDSQDWGDSSALQEFAAAEDLAVGGQPKMFEFLQEPTLQLLSSAFGAETSPEDSFLLDLVDTWVLVSTKCVATGIRSWTSCVDQYANTSWFQLLNTVQRRKYTGYYLALLVENGCCESDEARQIVLHAWLISLVEREGALKFQHRLTSALLKHAGAEILLQNLPFSKPKENDSYRINFQEFRQRRLSTISSVLSNVQTDFFEANDRGFQAALSVKRSYTEILRQVMMAMKSNYQELQADCQSETAQADTQGSYVEFVQQVVAMLQQYAGDVCQVDSFFTDSTAFPLPATDPTYVVGRLRSYAPKLKEPRPQKQLATFVHSVTERAVVDGQQPYLITQLSAALSDDMELDKNNSPTLRHVLLTSVFPVYIASCLTSTCAWILALPLLEASANVASSLLYRIKFERCSSVEAASEIFDCFLSSLVQPVELALIHPGLLRLSHVRRPLAVIYDVARACLTTVQYLGEFPNASKAPKARLDRLSFLARTVQTALSRSEDAIVPEDDVVQPAPNDPWPEARIFASRQVQEAFDRDWKAMDGQYYVRRGQGWKEVLVDLGEEDEEKEALLASLARFCAAHERILSGRAKCASNARGSDGHETGALMV